MSWLARRVTTRVEDMAYCMLGIWQVYMAPLYGEEENAFRRLQLELLQISDDESIFAWKASPQSAIEYPERGMLARSAKEFRSAGRIKYKRAEFRIPHHSMTSKGLLLQTPRSECLMGFTHTDTPVIYKVPLQCEHVERDLTKKAVHMFIKYSTTTLEASRVFPDMYAVPPTVRESTYTAEMHSREKKVQVKRHGVSPEEAVYVRSVRLDEFERVVRGVHVQLEISLPLQHSCIVFNAATVLETSTWKTALTISDYG